MSLVAFPPTYADLIASCSKPDAVAGNPSAAGIPQATAEKVLRQEADAAVVEALSDRIGADATVLTIDEGFAGHIIARALRRLMAYRGYDREAGADDEIVKQAERADEYVKACSPGAQGKRITPRYTLDTSVRAEDRVRIVSHESSDWWARSRFDTRNPRS